MVRRIPGHDTQGEPSDPAHLSDSLPLNTPDEPEIALFSIPGSAPGGKVQDVRRANRLMLPDLDLTASAELQALAASLMKAAADAQPSAAPSATDAANTTGADDPATLIDVTAVTASHDAAGDLPLHAGQADVLELTADDPGLEWFDDETEPAAAATPLAARVAFHRGLLGKASAASQVSARLLTWLGSIAVLLERLIEGARATSRCAWSIAGALPAQIAVFRARGSRLKQSRAKALHAWSRAALLSARIEAFDVASRLKRLREKGRHAFSAAARWSAGQATSVRHAASTVPLDDVVRGALFTAAVVTIVVVLARLDWRRPVELPDLVADTPDSSTALPEAPATTAGPDPLAGDQLTPFGRLAPSLPGMQAADPVETLAADVRRDAGEDATRGEPATPEVRRSEPAAPVQTARRGLTSDAVDAAAVTPPSPRGESATRGLGLDLPMAPATAAGLVPIDDAPPLPIADAVRTEAPPVETTEVAAGRPPPASTLADSDAIVAALSQLELAYERRDANLAKAIWPTVDARALARAFDSLRSQSVEFDGCRVKVTGGTGEVQCRGTTTYVPRVGSQFARTESRQWMFRLEKGTGRWVITRAAAR